MIRSLINVFVGKPTLCVYDVTTRCNSRCSMCSIWKRREEEMGIKEVEKVFTDLKRFGIHTVFLQGGEPLLQRDVFEIIGLLDDMGLSVDVISNGILMDGGVLKRLDEMNGNGRITVTISLDTLERKKYRKIRGVDKLDVVLRNISSLSRHPGLKGGVHATVTGINYGELEEIRKLVHGLGLEFSFNSYNDNINYASSKDSKLSFKKGSLEDVVLSMEKAKANLPYLYRPFIEDNVRYMRGEDVGPCDAFRHSLRITPDGKISPCLELPPVADLRKADINEKWGEIRKKMEGRIKMCYTKTPCFYGCTRGVGSVRKRPLLAVAGIVTALRKKRS